jgi:hypothetical protein
VSTIGTPGDLQETRRALIYLTLPFGCLERKHLNYISFIQTAQYEFGVERPLDITNRVQTSEYVDDFKRLHVPQDEAKLNHGGLRNSHKIGYDENMRYSFIVVVVDGILPNTFGSERIRIFYSFV